MASEVEELAIAEAIYWPALLGRRIGIHEADEPCGYGRLETFGTIILPSGQGWGVCLMLDNYTHGPYFVVPFGTTICLHHLGF